MGSLWVEQTQQWTGMEVSTKVVTLGKGGVSRAQVIGDVLVRKSDGVCLPLGKSIPL